MVNPMIAKEKAMTSEGRKKANELEELSWQIQMLQFELTKLDSKYKKLNAEYKQFLGYELTEKEQEDLKYGSAV